MAIAAAMAILETAVEATETATLEAGVVPEEAGAEALRPATTPVKVRLGTPAGPATVRSEVLLVAAETRRLAVRETRPAAPRVL
jgi:hypothetical protein